MINVHRHNPALRNRLMAYVAACDVTGLGDVLEQLSNNEFRTSGYLLATDLLPALPSGDAFMAFFLGIVPRSPKAYLGTFLRAAIKLYADGRLSLTDVRWRDYATQASDIDKRKLLDVFLPVAVTVDEAAFLLSMFCDDTLAAKGPFLLRAGTAICYFHLFRLLQKAEGDTETLQQYYLLLLRKADKRSYNMASIIRHYFGLSGLPGNFSLQLEPYELSRLELTPQSFAKILES